MKLNHALRTVVLASVVSLAAGTGGNANATLTPLGDIHVGPPTVFQGVVPPGGTDGVSGTFIDTFTFVLPPNGGSGYTVVNFPVTVPGGGGNFSTLFTSLTLWADDDATPGNGSNEQFLGKSLATGNATSLSLEIPGTQGGHMFLVVDGMANGTLGGLYSGAISVTPIPEPGVWLMMLGGIGLVGWVRLRNGRKAQLS